MQASYEVALNMKEENFYVFLLVEFSSKEFKRKESLMIAGKELAILSRMLKLYKMHMKLLASDCRNYGSGTCQRRRIRKHVGGNNPRRR
jgi:hypothetical protein